MSKIEVDFFAKFQYPTSLKSNRAGRLAFQMRQANMEDNTYLKNLWYLENGEARQLTFDGQAGNHWWLNQDTLVFSALRKDKDKEAAKKGLPLTVLHNVSFTRPGEAQELLRLDYEVSDLWFLEQDRFLFTANYNRQREEAFAAHETKEKALEALEKEKECTVFDELPFWANGSGVINGNRNRLYLYNKGEITPLTDEKTNVEQLMLNQAKTCAYFLANRYEAKAGLYNKLYELELSSLKLEDISIQENFNHGQFCVLPGSLLVFADDSRDYGINQNGNFYRLNPETKASVLLYGGGQYGNWNSVGSDVKMAAGVEWFASPEGNKVYWVTTLGGSSHLMSIDIFTGEIQQLTQQEGAVLEIANLKDGHIAMSAMRGLNAQELYSFEADGTEIQLTQFNTALLKETPLAIPEELSFVNSEGSTIRGWVLRPEGAGEDGKSYPAILNIHGGPKTVYGPVLFHEMQYWAALGFGVFFCNPTGSDGGGNSFADIRGRYGLIDYEDIMQFTDEVLAQHDWIDPDRMGVTGGSYGGFMTNWIIGHTGRFSAAASQRSISNWVTMSTTTDIGYFFSPDQTAADPWNDIDAVWEQSPLKYADKVSTPTLFIHSDEDYRCWMTEALQMYSALQIHNVPTRLCLFHGENHELSRSGKPAARVRRLNEITGWFQKYLNP